MIDPGHERRTRRALIWAFTLCLCALLPPLLSLMFRPHTEPPEHWFERSGAVTTVLAVFVQFEATNIATMIARGTFAELWEPYRKYKRCQAFANGLSLTLVVVGTVVWGHCDLLFTRL
jgi:hypothetical protein